MPNFTYKDPKVAKAIEESKSKTAPSQSSDKRAPKSIKPTAENKTQKRPPYFKGLEI